MNAYLNQYRNTQVQTASPEQILIMLYDGAIRFTTQAAAAIEARDTKLKIHAIDRAMAIIAEFNATLDHEVGGEIAANLAALYDFMLREMVKAKVRNDAKVLAPVLDILNELREAWVGAAEIVRKEKAAAGKPEGEDRAVAVAG